MSRAKAIYDLCGIPMLDWLIPVEADDDADSDHQA